MSLACMTSAHRRRFIRGVLFACLFVLFSATAFSQGGVGSSRGLPDANDGIHTIKGRVFFPEKPKDGTRLKITLKSADTTDQSTSTDEDGAFAFNRQRPGNYTVFVDGGKDYDSASEHATIDRGAGAGGTILNVNFNLKPKGSADAYSKIPKAARDLYAKGIDAAAKNDSKKAVEHLSGAVVAYPEFVEALTQLGVQYLKVGQPDKAAEALKAALKIAPSDGAARLNYGFALLSQKKFAEAEAELREVLKKNSAVPTAHMYLGIVLLTLSRDEKTKAFDEARYIEAQKEFESAITTGKEEVAQAHKYLGGIYWGNRDYKRAADEFEVYLKLTPKAPDAEKIRAAIKDLRSKG